MTPSNQRVTWVRVKIKSAKNGKKTSFDQIHVVFSKKYCFYCGNREKFTKEGNKLMETTETPKAEVREIDKHWQEFLQKCCEVGQIEHHLENLDSQKKELEKNLEVTKRAVKSASHKHKEEKQKELAQSAKEMPKEEASH